ncbi:hypothetical protein GOODEAATRI_034313 [Goodea atripinnis]|uniref:Uncharacterized protein n=1 Tax=Goodea atripinnis TaxID=208336 RepID=A0ABV0NS35_9TELE
MPQPNSVGIPSYTTDQLNLLAPAARQDTRTPVNLLMPVEPAASIFTAPQHEFQPLPEPQPVLQPRVNAGFLPTHLAPHFSLLHSQEALQSIQLPSRRRYQLHLPD